MFDEAALYKLAWKPDVLAAELAIYRHLIFHMYLDHKMSKRAIANRFGLTIKQLNKVLDSKDDLKKIGKLLR
jgi:DNA-binding Xre family transcriptional regulator